MIVTEVFDPDKLNRYKCVYYRSHGRVIRKALLNNDGSIVKDYLYEYKDDESVECIVEYGQDHVTITGVENFYYYENSPRIKYTEKFKFENNCQIRTQKAEHVYDETDRTCTVTQYRESDEPVGYSLYGYRTGDDFMSLLGCFNMNNERISCFELSQIPLPSRGPYT